MSQMKTRLQHAARLFFDRLPPPLQQQLQLIFRTIDADGNGRISLQELITWERTSSATNPTANPISDSALASVFAFVDTDGNGSLDFNECKGLFFIACIAGSHSGMLCAGCANLLVESAYTCTECKAMHSTIKTWNTFDLCPSCYAIFMSPVPFMAKNPKLMHPHRRMVKQQSELANAIDDMINQVQCAVCKEHHRSSTAEGILIQRHVIKVGRGPQERSVCEWCIACLCSACGKHFEGAREGASPGRWATEGPGTCMPCRQRGIMAGSPFTPLFSQEALMRMEKSPVFEKCSTCKAKVEDGSLINLLVRAMATPKRAMLGTANAYSNMFGQMMRPSGFNVNALMGSTSSTVPSTSNFNPFGATPGTGSNPLDILNMVNNNMGNNVGANPASPFDMLNYIGGMGGDPLNMLNTMGSTTGNPLGALNFANTAGLTGGSGPLDMLNMVNNMGNPLDLLSTASMCSIM